MKNPKTICQSCASPISREQDKGIEKTGDHSEAYCRRCYQWGSFTDPGMTAEEMRRQVQAKMAGMKFPRFLTNQLADQVYSLKRWKDAPAARN